ncbi:MAG: pilus assembly protein [Nocardioidaceae bacterium]
MRNQAATRGACSQASRGRDSYGAVTAEAAAVLPLVVALTIALVWLLSLAITQVRVVDAAREVARSAARGDDVATARAAGERVAPEGSRIAVETGERVRATVRVRVEGPGVLSFLPTVTLSAAAVAAAEPGVSI